MFLFCCPKLKKQTLKESLIENESSIVEDNQQATNKNSQFQKLSQKSFSITTIKNSSNSLNIIRQNSDLLDEPSQGYSPKFNQQPIIFQNQKPCSNLIWKLKKYSQMCYYNFHKEHEMFIIYSIKHLNFKTGNFISQIIKYNSQGALLVWIISSHSTEELDQINNREIHFIFSGFSHSASKKQWYSLNQNAQQQNIEIDQSHKIRLDSIDIVIFLLHLEETFQSAFAYCKKTFEKWKLQDLMKICLVLPAFFSISQISFLIHSIIGKLIINQPICNVKNYLRITFQIINGKKNEDKVIVIRPNLAQNNNINIEMMIGVGLLNLYPNSSLISLYEKIVFETINDGTLLEYIKLKQYLYKDSNQILTFMNKLDQLKVFSKQQMKMIKTGFSKQIQITDKQCLILIQAHKLKIQSSKIHKIQQENQQNFIKQEWDDNLRLQNIPISKNQYKTIQIDIIKENYIRKQQQQKKQINNNEIQINIEFTQ